MKTISSRQNPTVRMFRALAGQPDPAGTQLLLDGVHLVSEARATGVRVEVVAVAASQLAAGSEGARLAQLLEREGVDVIEASDRVFAALSPVRTPSGIVAIGRRTPATAAAICGHEHAFVLAGVDVQDPGNVGSLLRAAEAAGATGAFLAGASASPFSWKALRGSMGSALRLPVVGGLPTEDVLGCMERAGLTTIAAVPRGGQDPDAIDWRGRVGLLLGGEGPGLTDAIATRCTARVTIPMAPPVESLNVAVAGAVLCYAARRQRS